MRFGHTGGNPYLHHVMEADGGAGSGGDAGGGDDGDSMFLDDVILDLGEGAEKVSDKDTTVFGTNAGDAVDEDEDGKGAGEGGDDDDPSKKKDGDGEGDPAKKEVETSVIKSLRAANRAQEKRIKDLEKKVNKDSGKDGGDGGALPLTEEQLKALYLEHKDDEDPTVVLNIMRYMTKQGVESAQKAEAAVKGQQEVVTQVENYLSKLGDQYNPEEWQERIDKHIPADKWGLEGHPLEPQIRRMIYLAGHFDQVVNLKVQAELAKIQETGGKVERKRVEKINTTKVPPGAPAGGGNNEKVLARSAQVAKEIGLSESGKKIYEQFRTPKK